jgi:hypothetical protein
MKSNKDLSQQRRKSLIPKPIFNTSSYKKLSTHSTPDNSPIKKKNSENSSSSLSSSSPSSPSKLPISSNSFIDPKRKRSISTSLDDYVNILQNHISNDLDSEKLSLSKLSCKIEDKLNQYNQLCSQLKSLQKYEYKLNQTIFEYEFGIPVQTSILKEKSIKFQNEINNFKNNFELKKSNFIKNFQFKEEKLLNVFNDLVNDAKNDDLKTIEIRNKRLNDLKFEKENLLKELELAKKNMNLELENFKNSLINDNNKLKIKNDLINSKSKIQNKFKILQHDYNKLNENLIKIKQRNDYTENEIKNLELKFLNKNLKLKQLKFRISDVENLIIHLKNDLQNVNKLCTEFENDEYLKTKNNWNLTNLRLKNERYKRLKIEIQIREISGIPNLIIIENNLNGSFKNSNLIEFLKPKNYDWKTELLTTLESSLDGISSCFILCNEFKKNDDNNFKLTYEIQTHLQNTLLNNNRFENFQSSINILSSHNEISSLINQNIKLPSNLSAIHIKMTNKNLETSRESVILFINIEKTDELVNNSNNNNNNNIQEILQSVQSITIAEYVSDQWYNLLANFATIKPIHSRQAYSFLNDKDHI